MKKLISIVALLMIVSLAGSAFAGNDEKNGKNVSIAFYFPASNEGGAFSMVGGGDTHGAAEVTSIQVYADPNGNGQRISTTKVLHFPGGDVYMSTDGEFITSAAPFESSGSWTFTGGTSIYTDVSGGGRYHWFMDPMTGTVGAYTGRIKLDPNADVGSEPK